MNTLIVDDVKLSRDGLAALINTHFPEANIVGSVPSIEQALKLLKTEQIDLLFLDIHLKYQSSIRLVAEYRGITGQSVRFLKVFGLVQWKVRSPRYLPP